MTMHGLQLMALLAAVVSYHLGQAAQVPHVDQCNFCLKCHIGDSPPMTAAAARALHSNQQHHDGSRHKRQPKHISLYGQFTRRLQQAARSFPSTELTMPMLMVSQRETLQKQQLPNCTECYGCNTELQPMSTNSTFMGLTYHNEAGASASWLFRASTNLMPSGMAVAKVYCVPVAKRAGSRVSECGSARVLRVMAMYQALDKLSTQCGFTDILPKTWVGKVNAVMPNVGYHIRWHGLWMELVQGISLESLLNKGSPRKATAEEVLQLMHEKLNKTQVVRAAIFDLLTSQCDRHAQNIFIDEQGQLKMIDNEVALQNSWLNCGFDSIFIPTTQKHTIVRFSNGYVLKQVGRNGLPKSEASPQLLLDYRCYLDGGAQELGTKYPPQIKQCLSDISAMTVQQVKSYYGLAELPARNLHTRATDMVTKGFEWAMKYGEPQNAAPKRYLLQPPCCKVEWKDGLYHCAHDYKPVYELPIGDPTTGRDWKKARPDTGTFEGGSRYR